ncbi:FtsX-like permease family protein [Anaerolineales bacterium HSG6]|nr:FtsX-like permease family protein [Anaerolineales bacterium HSG6]
MLRGVLRKKIYSDLFDNLSRTIQVVLVIAIGSIAVGSIMGSLEFIQQDISANWGQTNPSSIAFALGDKGISQDLVDTMSKFPEVDQIEGQLNQGIKWRRSPDEPWQPAILRAREDYADLKLSTLKLLEGTWPRNKIMTANRGYGFETGEQIYIEIAGKERLVDIGGITWFVGPPPNFGGKPDFFTTKEHFSDLTGQKNHTFVSASIPGQYTESKAKQAAIRLEDEIDGQNVEVFPGTPEGTKIIDPTKHPAQDPIDGVFFILQVMAFAALVLGLFLVFNTITAIISQQVPQIGVLKAIGATRGQILGLYYTTVFVYGLLAVIISVPLGALGAHGLRIFMVEFMTMDVGQFGLSMRAMWIQVAICIISPLVTATPPIFKGSGITVREAISSYGLSGGGGLVDRLMAKLAFLPRMTSMAVSNTFRNKTRVFMTQITLVGAGVLFIAVLSTQESIRFTFGPVLFDTLKANIIFNFENEERFGVIERLVKGNNSRVAGLEMWALVSGEIRPAGQSASFDDRTVTLTGIPLPSQVYGHQLRAGRWLEPTDTFALVMHQKQARKIGVGVGDWVTLDIPLKQENNWQVVGLVNDTINPDIIIAPRKTLLIAKRQVGQGSNLYIKTPDITPEQDIVVAARLRKRFDTQGYDLTASETDTIVLLSEDIISQFNIIIYLLLIMAVTIAIIGGISLSGVLSINILERRVEIGILRSIGASNNAIGTLFVTEGILLGWLSWLIAVPISIPFSQGLNAAVGLAVDTEMVFSYATISIWIWLGIITVLGIVASWIPSRSAIQVSVRESLSYE